MESGLDNPRSGQPHVFWLTVEDNLADFSLMEIVLKDIAPEITLLNAPSGDAAIRFLRKQQPYENAPTPDLLLTDLNLPDMEGLELLRFVKASDEFDSLPVIVFSGTSDGTRRDECNAIETNCFREKPADLSALYTALGDLVSLSGSGKR